MRKNVLALSMEAMYERAIFEQHDYGTGRLWAVPYFFEHQPQSVIRVVNEDTRTKGALKVRFRGAANSDDILDFTVFLSPGNFPLGK